MFAVLFLQSSLTPVYDTGHRSGHSLCRQPCVGWGECCWMAWCGADWPGTFNIIFIYCSGWPARCKGVTGVTTNKGRNAAKGPWRLRSLAGFYLHIIRWQSFWRWHLTISRVIDTVCRTVRFAEGHWRSASSLKQRSPCQFVTYFNMYESPCPRLALDPPASSSFSHSE